MVPIHGYSDQTWKFYVYFIYQRSFELAKSYWDLPCLSLIHLVLMLQQTTNRSHVQVPEYEWITQLLMDWMTTIYENQ
jgi:hypothetical protein